MASSCQRPTSVNHYTLGPLGSDEQLSASNNAFPVALDHAIRCWQTSPTDNPWGQIPTVVNVDHYHVPTDGGPTSRADIFDVVDALNDAWPTAPVP